MKASTYVQRLNEACNYVKDRIKDRPDIGIILGSGLGSYGDVLVNSIRIPYSEIPQMLDTTVPGHFGCLIYGLVGDRKVLCLSGRSHQYEGLAPHEVQFAIRLLAMCGCKLCILTNAAGTRDPDLNPGDLTPIVDHMNTTHRGYTEEPLCFKDFNHLIQADMYDAAATEVAKQVAEEMHLQTKGCVYMYNFGPTYETSAEVEGQFKVGATNFGMSTVPEVVAMKELGVPVFAMSFVTNKAAGVDGVKLSHEDVTIAAKAGEPNMRALISEVIKRTPLKEFPIPVIEGDDHNINMAIPESFVTDKEIDEYAKQFGKTKIDGLVVLGACHELKDFEVKVTIDCNELPNFPILQHTSLKLNIGILNGKQLFVVNGLRNLTGLQEHELYYLIKLAKRLGAKSYIQTFQAGAFGEKGLAVVTDVIPFFEHPTVIPEICKCPIESPEASIKNKSILASFHGPEFPTQSDAKHLQMCGATHITLGTVKGLMMARKIGLQAQGFVDGAYNAILTSNDNIEAILSSCRSKSDEISQAIKTTISKFPGTSAGATPSFNATDKKAIQWNDTPSRKQNQQEDPEEVNAIAEALPDVEDVLLFKKEFKFYNDLKSKLPNVVEVKGLKLNHGELFGKKVMIAVATRALVRAIAQKKIQIIAINAAIATNPQLTDRFVTISDHINITGIYALIGRNKFGDRFPDMTQLYEPVKGLKPLIQFNVPDTREVTKAYRHMMEIYGAGVASDFGAEQATINRHSGGKVFKQISVLVNCLNEPWTIDDEVLKNAL
ncbi:purine-nucleoside phosphorylase [Histomonas meleagridis]|uniref:purine-nucleoside phosphorylase n=1 Tax=Histomonas meleagridis TaxID=135588 RepID=UPI003559E179|nr:purine-nucleoside phosphorylase [Histomonas meleagridis]KAH0796823.1 purine-nucleoside phosphorylase [Histomonas meleagridis]